MPRVRVVSEIGPLQTVLVHTPGRELLAVTPGTREEYLYDDIIELETARAEHQTMVSVLRRFATVLEVRDLLRDVVASPQVRDALAGGMQDVVRLDSFARRISGTPHTDFVDMLIEGDVEDVGPIARALNRPSYVLPALPNLFFTRDIGIVIGEHVCIGSMRYEARWSEELIIKTLFTHHEALSNGGILYDGSRERRPDRTLEGGDVHPVRDDLLIVGCSDRTSATGLDRLCELVFESTAVTDVVIVVMPGLPTAIHLDMLFTQIDHDVCVISPRHFIGPERLAVLHRRKGQDTLAEVQDLFSVLKSVDFALEPVPCGGTRRAVQEREQWASGCNLLTLKPGVTLAYRRNDETLRELADRGYDVVDADSWLAAGGDAVHCERTVITVAGSELVRGGGGPRCMTLPIRREDG